jgi:hypothetical protein
LYKRVKVVIEVLFVEFVFAITSLMGRDLPQIEVGLLPD